ncbi:carbohydrate esterase family 8 protein [Ilyonectria robusta]|uniref:carbohydrate esterase family 8 protein n=1 Tax=Ilyonectria robusta TaxID=1079257 RepID=UPI001E8E4CC6|nr:carbohydrate esterase family 8 protein [Ilyonectria robusta]KAH8736581.1 carbohydrate esterase family 8 protein [Ilyonectria robusta]
MRLLSHLLLAATVSVGSAAVPHPKRATARTSPPSGCKVVQQDTTTSGYYSTISAAVASLSGTSAACIFIYSGSYSENFTISYEGPLTLYGYTTNVGDYRNNAVTITHSYSSPAAGNLDASSTVNVRSSNFNMYNINVKNTYGAGAQAVALTANGDKQGYYGCGFYGYQDTLYAKSGYQYYSNCYVEGAVDYIFGKAAAWFGECTLASNGGGAITANSRETSSDLTWYVIDSSTITAASGKSLTGAVYLGRPWRVLARVIFQRSTLTDVVNANGWTTLATDATPIFEEFGNTGAGSSTTSRQYLTAATAIVTKSQLWPNGYSWIDTSY